MKLSKIEQETIILFNEGEADAEVYTHNVKLKNKLTKMAKKRPDLYRLKDKNAHGGVTYIFPKKLLTVMFRDEMSDKQHQNAIAQLQKMKNTPNEDGKTEV